MSSTAFYACCSCPRCSPLVVCSLYFSDVHLVKPADSLSDGECLLFSKPTRAQYLCANLLVWARFYSGLTGMGTVRVFPRVRQQRLPEIREAPWSLPGPRGGDHGGSSRQTQYVRCCPFLCPCTLYSFFSVNGAAGLNGGRVVERRLPARTRKAGPLAVSFIFSPASIVAGWL